jgi:zinc transporter ZupT
MNKKIKKIALLVLVISILVIPAMTFAQTQNPNPIMPDCGPNNECGFNDLMKLINNIIDWIIKISVPVAAGVFAWAGFLYMTTAVADNKNKAKRMFWSVFKGFVFILSAWIIVKTIMLALLNPSFMNNIPVKIGLNLINIHL